jgi:hypothetical protein
VRYGALSRKHHYISEEEMVRLKLNLEDVRNYNENLPHYQYAHALFNNMSEFFLKGKSIERSHNAMHNNHSFILDDGSFSVTNLLFYSYHSWIDAMAEFKLRRGNAEPVDITYLKKFNDKNSLIRGEFDKQIQ